MRVCTNLRVMITLRKSEVPLYLRGGELYAILMEDNEDPHEEVTFPESVLKPDTSVNSTKDCDTLLESLRFWGVTHLEPEELVTYVLSHEGVAGVLEKFENEFKYVHRLREIVMSSAGPDRMRCAIKSGMIELVRPLTVLDNRFPENACDLAAEFGNLNVFVFLLESGCVWQKRTALIAAQLGKIDIWKYLCELGNEVDKDDVKAAAASGRLQCIQFVLSKCGSIRSPVRFVVYTASMHGHLHILQYLVEQNLDWSRYSCGCAAQGGPLNCLKFMHNRGSQWNEFTCAFAAEEGHLSCLQYLHENHCPWDHRTCRNAAQNGHVQCLDYCHKHGCPWSDRTVSAAAEGGHLECMQYALEHGCPHGTDTCSSAASGGNINCLQYAYSQGHFWNESTCANAALGGHLDCLQFAHERDCPWNGETSASAAAHGHLTCLQYALEQGCPITESAAKMAAMEGHLSCLQCLRESGQTLLLSHEERSTITTVNPCYEFVQKYARVGFCEKQMLQNLLHRNFQDINMDM